MAVRQLGASDRARGCFATNAAYFGAAGARDSYAAEELRVFCMRMLVLASRRAQSTGLAKCKVYMGKKCNG